MSAPLSAPTRATCATTSGSVGSLMFSPLGYIMAMNGTWYSSHLSATIPSCSSISGSSLEPMLTWMEIASAPSLRPSRTEEFNILRLGARLRFVLAETCMIIPIGTGFLRDLIIPLCTRKAVAPPFATLTIISSGFSSPTTGPTVKEWSIGMQSILPFLVILLSLTCFPKTNALYLLQVSFPLHKLGREDRRAGGSPDCVVRQQGELQRPGIYPVPDPPDHDAHAWDAPCHPVEARLRPVVLLPDNYRLVRRGGELERLRLPPKPT